MNIRLQNLVLNYEQYFAERTPFADILLLHGFTGSCIDWDFLIPSLKKNFNVITLDLIGHGKSDSPGNPALYTIDAIISQIDNLTDKIIKNKLIMLGYSMGGRIALSYAAKHPEKLAGLILESTTWGIKDAALRTERIQNDEKVAEIISSNDMGTFINFWMDKDIFNSQKKLSVELLEKIKKNKSGNNKTGLVNSLLSSGTGKMDPLHNSIKDIQFPVLLITGMLDKKFTNINIEMAKKFFNAKHIIIPDAGHNVHLETPDLFINVINDFLIKLNFF